MNKGTFSAQKILHGSHLRGCHDLTREVQCLVVLHGSFTAPLGNSLATLAVNRYTRPDPLCRIYWHQLTHILKRGPVSQTTALILAHWIHVLVASIVLTLRSCPKRVFGMIQRRVPHVFSAIFWGGRKRIG